MKQSPLLKVSRPGSVAGLLFLILMTIIGCSVPLPAVSTPTVTPKVTSPERTETITTAPESREVTETATAAPESRQVTVTPSPGGGKLVLIWEAGLWGEGQDIKSFLDDPVMVKAGYTFNVSLSVSALQISPDGKFTYFDSPQAPKIEMRFCTAVSEDCQPDGVWNAIQPRKTIPAGEIQADWESQVVLTIRAQFRDEYGKSIPSMGSRPQDDLTMTSLQDVSTIKFLLQSYIPTLTPETEPVTGSVVVAGGASATGGEAGKPISIAVQFEASSPFGKVTEMSINSHPWEPFATEQVYTYSPPLNWSGWKICVQYRDEKGYTSPVYCDDISVEGNVPPPTPVPTLITPEP